MQQEIENIKSTIVALFADAKSVSEFGVVKERSNSLNEVSDLMESSPVTALADQIRQVVAKLADADPHKISEKPSWLDKFLGKSLEAKVRYQVARGELDELLKQTGVIAGHVKNTISAIELMLIDLNDEVLRLEAHIQAGREFLKENPSAGLPVAGSINFDNTRERFGRKLANLETLVTSHVMSIEQMKLTKAHGVDMLDRFQETCTILVPVWRQHTLALVSSKNMNPEMIERATKAHEALIKSLSQAMVD